MRVETTEPHTDSGSSRRWLLVDGFDDPFITSVAHDLASVARAHDAELVVLGEELSETEPFLRISRLDVARQVQEAALDDDAPAEADIEAAFRQANGWPTVTRAELLLQLNVWRQEALCAFDLLTPDLVIVWNGQLHLRSAYAQVARARALPCLFAERGPLCNTFYLDPEGIGPKSQLWKRAPAPTTEQLTAFAARLDEYVAAGKTGWPQPPAVGIDETRRRHRIPLGKAVILFVGQSESDTNVLLFSSQFRSNMKAISWCLSGMAENDFLLVKPHPKSVRDPDQLHVVLGTRGSVAARCHILDALTLADIVVTINSTVALEAAWRGKPVIVLEPTWPDSAGFAMVPEAGAPAAEVIARCRAEHVRRADAMQHAALVVGCHLDGACARLGEVETTAKVVGRVDRAHLLRSSTKRELATVMAALSTGATLPRWVRSLRRRAHRLRTRFNDLR